jgi:hypothetical protein
MFDRETLSSAASVEAGGESKLTSSAKSRSSNSDVRVHCMPLGGSIDVFMIQSITIVKMPGDNIHPCLMPVTTPKRKALRRMNYG